MKNRNFIIGVASLTAALAVILVLILTGWQPRQQRSRPIRVVTSLNFYGEAARAVAGKYGQVTSIINGTAVDPHDFQPSTSQAEQVARANVVIENGLGYDQWLSQLVAGNDEHQTVINVARQVAGKKAGSNEHVWYRPKTMPDLATILAKRYARLDPRHADYYRARAVVYRRSQEKLNKEIARAKANAAHSAQQQVDVTEPVFDYALENLGYQINDRHFAKAVEDGNDPSPADIKRLQDDLRQHKIAFLVENSQTSDRMINNLTKLARREKVPILRVSEAQPNKENYVEWMRRQYRQLIKIQTEENSNLNH
ncbi:metal ABC transporter solute-binding protein, Zn/Mn family [Limosilactobacillus difficilis]|uniref:metal ABC transporter solute-binding protein, Zn/Mn family n=1 Tax=Limosilactobacillus difficilis TaxID=2991838 RepID=UPI0024BA11D9|nr:zinc ABC transporter substrate-binding protein [Limosilactobacillus difficilis]